MKTIDGNLITLALSGQFDVICHGANCKRVMGAGIARQIAKAFPEAEHADEQTFDKFRELNLPLIGHVSLARHEVPNTNRVITILNWYTQVYPGGYGPGDTEDMRLAAISKCALATAKQFKGLRIGLPLIGCGLAGLREADVLPRLERAFEESDATLVRFVP